MKNENKRRKEYRKAINDKSNILIRVHFHFHLKKTVLRKLLLIFIHVFVTDRKLEIMSSVE